jgi:hypothetical protein
MLNLNPLFEDAILAMERHAQRVLTPPLPAALFMLQRDVINHYRCALTRNWDVPLDAPQLQNSSLGSPYDKWRWYANDDLDQLTFAIHGLVRYTSRLFHETTAEALCDTRRFAEMMARSDGYSEPIRQSSSRNIGIWLDAHQAVWVTPFGPELVSLRRDISDRSVLGQLRALGEFEIEVLSESNRRFGALCDRFHASRPPIEEYEAMNARQWVGHYPAPESGAWSSVTKRRLS